MYQQSNMSLFKCDRCIFSTTYEANLKRHMRRHYPEKFFNCDQCNEGNHRANFECHVRSTHSNLLYQCVMCEINASRKGNLNNHVQMKHEGLVFGCDDSDYKAMSNNHIIVHKQSEHEEIRCDAISKQNESIILPFTQSHVMKDSNMVVINQLKDKRITYVVINVSTQQQPKAL